MTKLLHGPSDILPYRVQWDGTAELNDASDNDDGWLQSRTISNSQWIPPTGMTVVSSNNDTVAAWCTLRNDSAPKGATRTLINRITTNDGLVEDAIFELKIEDY